MELVTSNINNVVHKKTKMEQNQTASNNNDEPPPNSFIYNVYVLLSFLLFPSTTAIVLNLES